MKISGLFFIESLSYVAAPIDMEALKTVESPNLKKL
jgi:hypothetical protein